MKILQTNIEVNYQIYINYEICSILFHLIFIFCYIYESLVLSTTIHQTREPNIEPSKKKKLQKKKNHSDFSKNEKKITSHDGIKFQLV